MAWLCLPVRLPMPGVLSAVDVQDLSGDEARMFEVEYGIDDVIDFSHASNRMELAESVVGVWAMHWGFDDAWRYGIHANAPSGVFDGQPTGDTRKAPLGQ